MDRFLGCDQTVTFVRHVADQSDSCYETIIVTGVGVQEETKLEQNGTTVAGADVCTVTIPEGMTEYVPCKEDFVVIGRLSTPPKRRVDLEALGHVYRVVAVNDYRGSILGHWEVIGV